MTWSDSVEFISGSGDAPGCCSLGLPAQGVRRCSQAEKQAPSSNGHQLALKQRCVREARGHRALGQKQVQSFVSFVDLPAVGVSHVSRPRVRTNYPSLCSMLNQQKGCADESESGKSYLSLSR